MKSLILCVGCQFRPELFTCIENSYNLDLVFSSVGAWTEKEIDILLDAWEEAVKTPRTPGKVFDIAEKVLNILSKKDFRAVERDEVWKQMSTLRTEYRYVTS